MTSKTITDDVSKMILTEQTEQEVNIVNYWLQI